MKHLAVCWILALALTLCGCSGLLEREYVQSEPHSEKYWDAGDSSVLRAVNHQELVNDILTLFSAHKEDALLRLYIDGTLVDAEDMMEAAAREAQEENAFGAYVTDYLTYTVSDMGGFFEIRLATVYRRTAEQAAAIRTVTSSGAIGDLLRSAFAEGRPELTIRIRYFSDTEDSVREALLAAEAEAGLAPDAWQVYFYPAAGENRILEFLPTPAE